MLQAYIHICSGGKLSGSERDVYVNKPLMFVICMCFCQYTAIALAPWCVLSIVLQSLPLLLFSCIDLTFNYIIPKKGEKQREGERLH